MGREHREEVVDRRTVSKTNKHAKTWVEKKTTHTHIYKVRGKYTQNVKGKEQIETREREEQYEQMWLYCAQTIGLSGYF